MCAHHRSTIEEIKKTMIHLPTLQLVLMIISQGVAFRSLNIRRLWFDRLLWKSLCANATDTLRLVYIKNTAMSRPTTRRSVRLSSSFTNLDVADSKKASTKRKQLPKNKPTTKKPKATPELKYTPTEGKPWYFMFTKGDEEYDKYMSTEWGFEKVSEDFFTSHSHVNRFSAARSPCLKRSHSREHKAA